MSQRLWWLPAQLCPCTPDSEFLASGGGEKKNPLLITLWVTRESCAPRRIPVTWQWGEPGCVLTKIPTFVPSILAASALPKAWGCLSNALLCPVSCGIFLFLLSWHAKVVEYLLPKLLPLKFSLSLSPWFTLSQRISLYHFIIIFDTKSNVFKMLGQAL